MALRIRVTRMTVIALVCLLAQALALPLPVTTAFAASRAGGEAAHVTPTATTRTQLLKPTHPHAHPRVSLPDARGSVSTLRVPDAAAPSSTSLLPAPATSCASTTTTAATSRSAALRTASSTSDTPGATTAATPPVSTTYGDLPLSFEPNVGQTDPSVSYLAHGRGYGLYLTATEAELTLMAPQTQTATSPAGVPDLVGQAPACLPQEQETALHLAFVGANPLAQIVGQNVLPGTVNYFRGTDPSAWLTGVPTYAQVAYTGLYPGVDLVYYGTAGRLEYDFHVAAGANPSVIALSMGGASSMALDSAGNLVLQTAAGPVEQPVPVAYQEVGGQRQDVAVHYRLTGPTGFGFTLGAYDPSQPLVIDPVLRYATYLGGTGPTNNGNTWALAMAVDGSGDAYATGYTYATTFITTTGAVQTVAVTGAEAYVTKLNPTGTAALFSTYLGGHGDDFGTRIAVDSSGNAYLSGYTSSTDFPHANALQPAYGGGAYDGFAAKLNASGTSLVYSTYLGGSNDDRAYGIAVDSTGNAYVTGLTASTNFITTTGTLQGRLNGGTCVLNPCENGYVTKIDPNGVLKYSTYLGGNAADYGDAIAVDSSGNAYITGDTTSTNFPTTSNGLQTAHNGATVIDNNDAFVAELDATASTLLYGSYLGGSRQDLGRGIAVDAAGHIYVAGQTQSVAGQTNVTPVPFPTTPGAYQTTNRGGYDAFVAKLTPGPSSTTLNYSTLLGSAGDDIAYGLAIDTAGNAYITGQADPGQLIDFPFVHPLQEVPGNSSTAFVAELPPDGSFPIFSTPLGGSGSETGYGIAVDTAGNVYADGATASVDFPTVTPLQPLLVNNCVSAYVAKIAPLASGGDLPWHPHQSVSLGSGLDVSVDLDDGHMDVGTSDLHIPGRGPDMMVSRTWDSELAQHGGTSGWLASLTPQVSGALTASVLYTDSSGAVWPFRYMGSPLVAPPYTSYYTPPGLPWQLTTAPSVGYTLTNILTGEVLTFDPSGRALVDSDAYGNSNTLSYTSTAVMPMTETNSGGRTLKFYYDGTGRMTAAQSPLSQASGTTQGQLVAYGYNTSSQVTARIQGYGSSGAVTTTFGYSGTQLQSVTTGARHQWTFGYDGDGRVTSITSPASGTVGQVGYTPAYTTQILYSVLQAQVVAGSGSSAPLTTTYVLSGWGEPRTTADGLNDTQSASYDRAHDVLTSTDANGITTTNYYQYVGPNGAIGQITETVAPSITAWVPNNATLSAVQTFHYYDPSTHDLTETVRPEGGATLYTYDGHHSISSTVQQIQPLDCEPTPCAAQWQGSINSYDPYGELTASTDGRGVSVSGAGVATLSPNPTLVAAYTQHQTYTTAGDVQSASTPPITTTLNGQLQVSVPATTTYAYNGDGQRTAVISPNGKVTYDGYDHLGRPIYTVAPPVTIYNSTTVSPTTYTFYDGDNNPVYQQDANGNVTTSSYDPLGRLVATTNAVSGTTVYTYNATEQTAVQDPLGNVSTSQYDAAGRLTQQTNPVSGTVQDGYDAVGNTTAVTSGDTSGNITQTETISYNALDEPTTDTISGPSQPPTTTLTAYNLDGSVAQVQNPNGDVVYNTYDAADRLLSTEIDAGPMPLTPTSAATHATYDSYSYDPAGNTTLHVDADGRASTTQYDGDNRVVQSVDATSAPTGTTTITTTPSYDPNGNTITQTTQTADATNPGVVATHTYTDSYNSNDWVTSSGDDGKAVSYSYDANGQERSLTQYDPSTITMVPDPEGRITAIGESTNGTGPYTSTFGYNGNDLPITATLGNTVQQSAQYDPGSRLRSLSTTGATGLSPSTYSYGYNALDWTTSATGISGTDTITHNALGRLTAESGPSVISSIPNQTYSWGYDGNGNVITGTDDFGTVYTNTYSTSQPNQLVQSYDPDPHSNPTNTVYFAYDNHGDTKAITTSGSILSSGAISTGLTYNAQEQPITITHKDADYSTGAGAVFDTINAQYNAQGQRSHYTVVVSGTAILDQRFSYQDDGTIGQVVATTATLKTDGSIKDSGAYTDTYVYTQDGEPLEFVRARTKPTVSTDRYWYVLDGRNNVVAVTDSTGKVVDSYAYDSWGEPLTGLTKQQVPQQYRYGSYWLDDAVGWYWATTRYYDPEIMRWMQPDISELDGVHTYVYVGDDPVDLTDPLGLLTCSGSHDILSWFGDIACNAGNSAGTWWNQHTEPVYAPASEADLAQLEDRAAREGVGKYLSDINAVNVALWSTGGLVEGKLAAVGLSFVGGKIAGVLVRLGADRVLSLFVRGGRVEEALITIYRGTRHTADINAYQESGYIMSEAALRGYFEARLAGMPVDTALQAARTASEAAHAQGLRTWGTLRDYALAHAEFGQELSREFGPRSMISFSTDPQVATDFAKGGTVFTAAVRGSEVVIERLPSSNEAEVLVLHMVQGTTLP